MKCVLLAAFILLLPLSASQAQTAEDEEGVRRAILNYVEGFYEGDSTKIAMGVHPDVNKRGFYVPRDAQAGEYVIEPMSFQEMFDYTRSVRESGNFPGDSAPKEIEIYDVMDQTASAKLTAWWGSDYMLLGKSDGVWKIYQVLWQTPPPER